jgi:hypothetical protein
LIGSHVIKLKTRSLEDGMEIPLHLTIDSLAYLDLVSS